MTGRGTGGSSARRSTAQNIGLYGRLPAIGEASGTGRVGGGNPGRPGAATGGSRPGGPGSAQGSKPPGAMGTADAAIPAPYRRRVAEYFQRVADETGGR